MDHQQLEYEGSLVENLFLMRSLAFNLLNFLFDMFAILQRPGNHNIKKLYHFCQPWSLYLMFDLLCDLMLFLVDELLDGLVGYLLFLCLESSIMLLFK
jgi:hypothetical protein